MSLFNEKTMESLKSSSTFEPLSEQNLLLINGGVGCSTGSQYTPNSSSSGTNRAGGIDMVWGALNTIFWGGFGLSCTLW